MKAGKWPASQAPRWWQLVQFRFHLTGGTGALKRSLCCLTAIESGVNQVYFISIQKYRVSKITCDLNDAFRFFPYRKRCGG